MQQKSERIIRLRQTIEKTGLSRSTIYSLEKRGGFPKKINLSLRTMGFLESEIDQWLLDKIEERDTRVSGKTSCFYHTDCNTFSIGEEYSSGKDSC